MSKGGTITPSSDGGVVVHLEGSSREDIHGFSGKVEKETGGGEMKEVLLVWDEDNQVSSRRIKEAGKGRKEESRSALFGAAPNDAAFAPRSQPSEGDLLSEVF